MLWQENIHEGWKREILIDIHVSITLSTGKWFFDPELILDFLCHTQKAENWHIIGVIHKLIPMGLGNWIAPCSINRCIAVCQMEREIVATEVAIVLVLVLVGEKLGGYLRP